MTHSPYSHKEAPLLINSNLLQTYQTIFYAVIANKNNFTAMTIAQHTASALLRVLCSPVLMPPLCLHICFALLSMLPPPHLSIQIPFCKA